MRSLTLLLLAAALGGCLDAPTPAAPLDADGTLPTLDAPVDLASATLTWHAGDVLEPYHIATQPIANPCLYGEGRQREPYFNNLPVSDRTPVQSLPAGTRAIEVTLDWTDADYLGDALVLAYREDGAWRTSPYLPKGTSIVDVQDVTQRTHLEVWLCVWGDEPTGSADNLEPRFFAGDVAITLRALGTDA